VRGLRVKLPLAYSTLFILKSKKGQPGIKSLLSLVIFSITCLVSVNKEKIDISIWDFVT
jgi:hypothetical protein